MSPLTTLIYPSDDVTNGWLAGKHCA